MTENLRPHHTLGPPLRTLRITAGMTGGQLAAELGWSPSKVSKIENGQQTPSERDVRAWADATDAEAQVDELIASLHTVEFQHAEWRSVLRLGLLPRHCELADRDAETTLIRIFGSAVIPDILQTPDYARARFTEAAALFAPRGDVDAAVQTQLRWQDLLYNPDKKVHIVLTEAAVRNRLGPAEILQAQLDRLVALTAVSTVRFGILPADAHLPVAPLHGFHVFDNDRVVVVTFGAELTLAQPAETELYGTVFDQLAAIAVYGASARSLLTSVMDDIARADETG